MKVYKAINAVQKALCRDGIGKNRSNQQQGYKFRGIDDMYNAISPLLAEHGLCILPRILSRHCDERTNKSGSPLFYITVEAEFDFICSEDGSKHTVKTYGEAMDSGDKATNKAMSAAYKYAVMQGFAIPTEGDNDADAHTHDVAPRAVDYITPDQVTVLVDLIAETGARLDAYLKFLRVPSLDKISKEAFDSAKRALEAKRVKLAEEA